LILVVQAGIELIADVTEKIRQGIYRITDNDVSERAFYQYAKYVCHLNVARKLSADLAVYWDTTYRMLGGALYYNEVLNQFCINL
jgi:hypothetical protein